MPDHAGSHRLRGRYAACPDANAHAAHRSALEATGFPAEQYGAAAKLITDYLKGEGDFQLVFSMNGIAYNAFNEREQTHMADVRTLFSLCRRFSLGSILLTLVGWLYSRKQRFFWRIVRRTACCMLAFVAILALLAAMDFDRLFILFHQIAFTNNLWLLNPQTDLLIRLMPTQLFIDYAQIIGIVWAALMGDSAHHCHREATKSTIRGVFP